MSRPADGETPGSTPEAGQDGLVTVRIVQAPLLLWEQASQYTDELLREFALISIGAEQGSTSVPRRLLDLVDQLRTRYEGVGDEATLERQAALAAGETSTDLDYHVPPQVAEACRSLGRLLDESDEYCRSGQLMTLPSPDDQRAFRQWYLGEFVRQVAGEPPVAWPDANTSGTSVRWDS